MKLLNYTTSWFAAILLFIISIWAVLFYYAMLDEIYDSIDDGLDNQKGLVIQKVTTDSTILYKSSFEEGDYAIKEIEARSAIGFHDRYMDTLMYMQNEKDFEPVRLLRTVFKQNDKYYQLQVITSMVEEDDLFTELLASIIGLYIGLVATILLLNNFLLKRIWKPFYHLLSQLKKFRLGTTQTINTKQTNIDEFRLLNERVGKLLQSNMDVYESQKHFIENASHELQTPLAISINKLEALAETGKLTGDDLQLLVSALNNLERLTRLNKSLLLLSKIENRQYENEEAVNMNDLVKRVTADFADQLAYSNLHIHVKEEGNAHVNMNIDLASTLVINLIKNAIVHNQVGGTINIIIRSNSLLVDNNGGQTPLNEGLLFTRFNKENQSASSTGLGLAIVKAIADLYAFNIAYSYNGRHTFQVTFN